MKKKMTVVAISIALVISFVVGGTLAWLVDSTQEVKNTFTYGDINIDLWEHELSTDGLTLGEGIKSAEITKVDQTGYKMIPGNTIDKDPTITVKKDSEACWLFVEVVKSSNFDNFMKYKVDSKWTLLEENGLTSVYYYNGNDLNGLLTDDKTFNILGGGTYVDGVGTTNEKTYTWGEKEVFVLPSVTKEMLKADGFEGPTLTFTAYAVQKDNNITTAAAAWEVASN